MVLKPKRVIEFDAHNHEHNVAFANFLREGSWPEKMDYRFNVREPYTSVVSYVQNAIVTAWLTHVHGLEIVKQIQETN